jgi:hypothetical protein
VGKIGRWVGGIGGWLGGRAGYKDSGAVDTTEIACMCVCHAPVVHATPCKQEAAQNDIHQATTVSGSLSRPTGTQACVVRLRYRVCRRVDCWRTIPTTAPRLHVVVCSQLMEKPLSCLLLWQGLPEARLLAYYPTVGRHEHVLSALPP